MQRDPRDAQDAEGVKQPYRRAKAGEGRLFVAASLGFPFAAPCLRNHSGVAGGIELIQRGLKEAVDFGVIVSRQGMFLLKIL